MRGYPAFNTYEVTRRLIQTEFLTPNFRTPLWSGPEEFGWQEEVYPVAPLTGPSYAGPIVLLVSPKTVSAAEDFPSG
ncbi:hypothetical protein KRR26_20250 [Corallococcus sp. M34]|uniref:hypothetical protein n=1 Tax=Citreicoccus inhibens TaxID=2849499 RepID=UPI0011C3E9C0|nr:hypothetical protein [Citreicoccus inhibens]MBU8897952.1 hypothetical protein [Citreicoccus inhibens]